MNVGGVIGSSLGTLGNVALTWEGRAAKIAGRMGMVGALAASFLELLFPPADPPPPVTKEDLTQALASMDKAVIQALWLQEASKVKVNIDTFNNNFQDNWDDLTQLALEPEKDSSGKVVGSRPVIDETDQLTPTWLSTMEGYYFPAGTGAQDLDRYRLTLEDANFNDTGLTAADIAHRQVLTMQLYVMIGSLMAAYHQSSIAWRWGQEMLLYNQFTRYNKDHDDWSAQVDANPKYAASHPEADLLNPYPALIAKLKKDPNFLTEYTAPVWHKWATEAGSPVKKLQETMDNLLAYCVTGKPATDTAPAKPGMYTDLRKKWDALEAAAAAGLTLAPGVKPTAAQMKTAMAEARDRAANWSSTVVANNLQGVVEDDVLGFGTAIDAWRTLRASVSFHYYTTVTAAETLTTVAQDQYGDASLAAKIAQYNPDVTAGLTVALPLGTELKIFDKAWLPYVDLAKEIWPRPVIQAPAH